MRTELPVPLNNNAAIGICVGAALSILLFWAPLALLLWWLA